MSEQADTFSKKNAAESLPGENAAAGNTAAGEEESVKAEELNQENSALPGNQAENEPEPEEVPVTPLTQEEREMLKQGEKELFLKMFLENRPSLTPAEQKKLDELKAKEPEDLKESAAKTFDAGEAEWLKNELNQMDLTPEERAMVNRDEPEKQNEKNDADNGKLNDSANGLKDRLKSSSDGRVPEKKPSLPQKTNQKEEG